MGRGQLLMPNYKAVDADRLDADLAAVAETIRAKSNTSEPLEFPGGFQNAVDAIQTGGKLQSKTVSPSHSDQTVVPDEDCYGLESVTVKAVPKVKSCGVIVIEESENAIEAVVNVVVEITAEFYLDFTSACYETTSGTSLTGTIEASAGDWILATVTTRSETTLPDGWTVLKESTVLNADALNQRMFFLCKQASADGTESITIGQSESARIYINLMVAKGAAGFAYHEGTEVYSDTEKADRITAGRLDYRLLVWGCTAILWNTDSSAYGTWTCSGLTPICLDSSSTQPRQANFVDRNSSVSERTFFAKANTYYIIDCVEVLY